MFTSNVQFGHWLPLSEGWGISCPGWFIFPPYPGFGSGSIISQFFLHHCFTSAFMSRCILFSSFHSYIRSFVHDSVPFMELFFKFYVKVTQVGYISATHLSESIPIYTIGTWRVGFHSMTPDHRVHGPGWG